MKLRIVAKNSFITTCIVVSFFSFYCQNNTKKADNMNVVNVSQNADSLAEYFTIPNGSECKWLIKPMGEMNPRVPGPTDYELSALIHFPDNSFIEQLAADCPAIEELDDGIPIDAQTYNLLGMESIPGGKNYNGKMIQNGRAINMDSKIQNPFSNGVGLIINPTLLFVTATTF